MLGKKNKKRSLEYQFLVMYIYTIARISSEEKNNTKEAYNSL
jgi:hypothetical protein